MKVEIQYIRSVRGGLNEHVLLRFRRLGGIEIISKKAFAID